MDHDGTRHATGGLLYEKYRQFFLALWTENIELPSVVFVSRRQFHDLWQHTFFFPLRTEMNDFAHGEGLIIAFDQGPVTFRCARD